MIFAENGGPVMSGAETTLFWIAAPLIVVAASFLLFARRAVYAAVALVVTMIGLAFFYVASGAPFLGVAQVVVYTGAIMMLFVFVLMLVGVDVADSPIEAIRGHRIVTAVCALGLACVLGAVVWRTVLPDAQGIRDTETGGNPAAVARTIFADLPFTLEVTGILLIIAAIGAVILTHRVKLRPRRGQREKSIARFSSGILPTPPPASGVYAGHNAADVPAIDADGRVIDESVPQALRARDQMLQAEGFEAKAALETRQKATAPEPAELPPAPPPSSERPSWQDKTDTHEIPESNPQGGGA